ncbi:MAG: hypothetical protein WKG00_26360 [Polyangiaceae bacterium]
MRTISFGLFSAALLSVAVMAGCADSDGVSGSGRSDDGGQDDGDDGATTGVGGSAAGTGGGAGTGGAPPAVCPDATDVYEVEAAPSNVLFLFDRSGSMHLTIDVTSTRWIEAKAGLFAFIDALPSDTNAGIQLFPRGDSPIDCCVITAGNDIDCGACVSGELPEPEARCTADAYLDPNVDVGPLSAARRNQIKSAVSASDEEFYWGTPLAPALEGAVQSQITASATGVSSVVLITDGNPTSCDTTADPEANDIQRVVDAAAAGLGAASPCAPSSSASSTARAARSAPARTTCRSSPRLAARRATPAARRTPTVPTRSTSAASAPTCRRRSTPSPCRRSAALSPCPRSRVARRTSMRST